MNIEEIMARALIAGQWSGCANKLTEGRIDRIRSLGEDSSYNVIADSCVNTIKKALKQEGYVIIHQEELRKKG